MSNTITDLLGDAFADNPDKKVRAGVVCITPIPYIMNDIYVVKPLNSNPSSPQHQQYQLRQTTAGGLASSGQDEWALPHKDLNMDSDEDLMLVKVKRRPVLVISQAILDERKIDTQRFQDSFWCVPSYTLVDSFGVPRMSKGAVENIRALSYKCCFPLPFHSKFNSQESVLRFDRMQPIVRDHLDGTELKLTDNWLSYMRLWIRFYMTGAIVTENEAKNNKLAVELGDTRQVLMELLEEERSKKK